jgi:hypothetical protein
MNRTFSIIALAISLSVSAQEWAMPHISVANVRTTSGHSSEMSTQALMGTPIKVLSHTDNGWCEVQLPDGYKGYIIDNSLTFMSQDAINKWKRSQRVIVSSPSETKAYYDTLRQFVMSDMVSGDIVALLGNKSSDMTEIILPDGREGWIASADIKPLEAETKDIVNEILTTARQQMGTPYLWGGLSSKGMDCSGLTKLAFMAAGIIIPRDASQQALVGTPIERDKLQPGDLVFFGNTKTGRINHVGIYEGNGYILESAGRVKRTLLSSMSNYITARRLLDVVDKEKGVTNVTRHPWYFLVDK